MMTPNRIHAEATNRLALQVIKLHNFSEQTKRKFILESITFISIAIFSALIIHRGGILTGLMIIALASSFLIISLIRAYRNNLIVKDAMNEVSTYLHILRISRINEPEAIISSYNRFVNSFKESTPTLSAITILELL